MIMAVLAHVVAQEPEEPVTYTASVFSPSLYVKPMPLTRPIKEITAFLH